MRRWFWRFVRSHPEPSMTCHHCRAGLLACRHCRGAYLAAACCHCALGWTCATHGTHWLV